MRPAGSTLFGTLRLSTAQRLKQLPWLATVDGAQFLAKTLNGWARHLRDKSVWLRSSIFLPSTMSEEEKRISQRICDCYFYGYLVDVDESSFNSQRRGKHGILLSRDFTSLSSSSGPQCAKCGLPMPLSAIWALKGLEDATGGDFTYPGRDLVHTALEEGLSEQAPRVHCVSWREEHALSVLYAPSVAILPIKNAAHVRHSEAKFSAQLAAIFGGFANNTLAQLLECGEGGSTPPTTTLDEMMDHVAPPGDARVARERPFLYLVGRPSSSSSSQLWPLTLQGGNYWLIVRNVRLAISWQGGHSYTITTIPVDVSRPGSPPPFIDASEDSPEQLTMLSLDDSHWFLVYVPSSASGDCRVAILPSLSSRSDALVYFRGSREAIRPARAFPEDENFLSNLSAQVRECGGCFFAYRPSHHVSPIQWGDDAERMEFAPRNPSLSFFGDVFPTARAHASLPRVFFAFDDGDNDGLGVTPWIITRDEEDKDNIPAPGRFLELPKSGRGAPCPDYIVLFDEQHVYRLKYRPFDTSRRPPQGLKDGWHLEVYHLLTIALQDSLNQAAHEEDPLEQFAQLFGARIPSRMPIDLMRGAAHASPPPIIPLASAGTEEEDRMNTD